MYVSHAIVDTRMWLVVREGMLTFFVCACSYTMAPEVLKGKYSSQADIWSIGVIAYMLLSSQMPFFGRKRKQIVQSIMKGTFDFKGRRWKRLSAQSKEFVRSLLVVDPEERLDADEALSAVWLNRRLTATVRNPYEEELEGATNSIVRYANYSKLKKMALMVVAHKSSTQEIGILRKIFQKYDTQKDGQLSYDEFKAALQDAGVPEDECERIFDSVVRWKLCFFEMLPFYFSFLSSKCCFLA